MKPKQTSNVGYGGCRGKLRTQAYDPAAQTLPPAPDYSSANIVLLLFLNRHLQKFPDTPLPFAAAARYQLALELRSNGSEFCSLKKWCLSWNVSKAIRLHEYLPQLRADCAPLNSQLVSAYEEL